MAAYVEAEIQTDDQNGTNDEHTTNNENTPNPKL
ncbi:unnamed protein product, partial [Rotaria sp. Silwood2]